MKKKYSSYHDNQDENKYQTQTNFRAIKQLLDTQIQIQSLKNRLKVLEANDHKNNSKISQQNELINKLQHIRNQHIKQIQNINCTKIQRQKILEEIKQKNQEYKINRKNRMNIILEEIAQGKVRQYLQICQQRQAIQMKISENKQKDLYQKQFKRNKVIEREEQSKQHYQQFKEHKVQAIIEKNKRQIEKINQKRIKKQRQLQQISNLELQLLVKQSESQIACENMKNKLDIMVGRIKLDRSRIGKNTLSTQKSQSRVKINYHIL